ncbi:hypothetical protein SADO_08062 [Salinisphaera dokdonensis CL-ES53]|uniref:Ribbon-helix-helix domain-containing protein n=1 Tax=Salinisphaera dokdonensis CL-ES53 TaxID=1304272 RepID=A0ABV2AZX2_9GAMM
MCNIYASANPKRYESTTRSVRLQGFVTSVRLENEFWEILEGLAAAEGRSVSNFISTLHGEVVERQGAVANLTSMLRVACAIHLHGRVAESDDDASADTRPLRLSTGT